MTTLLERQSFLDACTVTHLDIGPGCRQYMAWHPEFPGPVGFVWCRSRGGDKPTAYVIHSYTVPYYRRRGIRALLNRAIFAEHEVIETADGSDEGLAFMHSAGYTQDPMRGDWYLLRPTPTP